MTIQLAQTQLVPHATSTQQWQQQIRKEQLPQNPPLALLVLSQAGIKNQTLIVWDLLCGTESRSHKAGATGSYFFGFSWFLFPFTYWRTNFLQVYLDVCFALFLCSVVFAREINLIHLHPYISTVSSQAPERAKTSRWKRMGHSGC